MANVSSMLEAGHPKLVLWANLKGQVGEGDGRGFRMVGDTCIPKANSC